GVGLRQGISHEVTPVVMPASITAPRRESTPMSRPVGPRLVKRLCVNPESVLPAESIPRAQEPAMKTAPFLVLSLTWLLLLAAPAEGEPCVNGRPLSSWIGLLKHGGPVRRGEALVALGHLGRDSPGVAEALIDALEDPDLSETASAVLAGWQEKSEPILIQA